MNPSARVVGLLPGISQDVLVLEGDHKLAGSNLFALWSTQREWHYWHIKFTQQRHIFGKPYTIVQLQTFGEVDFPVRVMPNVDEVVEIITVEECMKRKNAK